MEHPGERLDRLVEGLGGLARLSGIDRHAALVAALVEAGELAQGLLDHAFQALGTDALTPLWRRCMELLRSLGGALLVSYTGRLRHEGPAPALELVERLRALRLPREVPVKVSEGYAFYALYPETYLEAARVLRAAGGDITVIGIRSVGASLAGVVAAAAGATRLPLTVRPIGPPFERVLSVSRGFAAALRRGRGGAFAIADEGPGLSGSSFAAVAELLEALGVEPHRLRFFPSHPGGPGPRASERTRARWARTPRRLVEFDALFMKPSAPLRLADLVEDLTGPASAPLEDLSAGAWRAHLFPSRAQWPAANVQQERRKYLMRTEQGAWLLKFAGLGRYGRVRLERGQRLGAAGLIPQVAGLRHGFLIQRWVEPARPLPVVAADRRAVLEAAGAYLATLAREFRVPQTGAGASLGRLLEMARHNAAQALGAEAGRALEGWSRRLRAISERLRPVQTDNKLQPWEWLVPEGGGLLKADALDHHQGHDLVGCQDIAWDVAGAIVELGLSAGEGRALSERIARDAGARVDPEKLELHLLCYLAFQVGYHWMAGEAMAELPEEAERARVAADRYAALLGERLGLAPRP